MYDNNIDMKKGFTLIELLIVIAILGILATGIIGLVNPSTQINKANDSKRKADLAKLQAGFELFRSDNGSYPGSLPTCGNALTDTSGTTYIKDTPCDPNGSAYTYRPSAAPATSYSLITCLENTSDPQADSTNNTTVCSTGVSYTVSNP